MKMGLIFHKLRVTEKTVGVTNNLFYLHCLTDIP